MNSFDAQAYLYLSEQDKRVMTQEGLSAFGRLYLFAAFVCVANGGLSSGTSTNILR